MRKFLIMLLFIAAAVPAKTLVFDICAPSYCYVQKVENTVSWRWMTAFNGMKFVRVYLEGGWLLDIQGERYEIKARK